MVNAEPPALNFRWLQLTGLAVCLIPCVPAVSMGLCWATALIRHAVAVPWTRWYSVQALMAGVATTMELGGMAGLGAVLVATRGLRRRPRPGREQLAISLVLGFSGICAAVCALEEVFCLLVLLAVTY